MSKLSNYRLNGKKIGFFYKKYLIISATHNNVYLIDLFTNNMLYLIK